MHTPIYRRLQLQWYLRSCSGEAVLCGFWAPDALKKWSRGPTWGSCDRASEVIFAYPLPQVRLLMLLLIGGYF